MSDLIPWIPLLLQGLLNTALLFAAVLVLGLLLALATGLARLSRSRALRWVSTVYVELFRGVPLYVTLFWFYFALPRLGVQLNLWQASVIACTLTHGAYGSEYVRAAVQSISSGQHEAAVALSMSTWQRIRYVILPQTIVALLPVMGSEYVMLLKGTSIVSLIGFADLTAEAHSVIVSTYQAVPVLTVVLLTYYVLAKVIVVVVALMERRSRLWSPRQGPVLS
jgi:polar amino acid transport system permease protein